MRFDHSGQSAGRAIICVILKAPTVTSQPVLKKCIDYVHTRCGMRGIDLLCEYVRWMVGVSLDYVHVLTYSINVCRFWCTRCTPGGKSLQEQSLKLHIRKFVDTDTLYSYKMKLHVGYERQL